MRTLQAKVLPVATALVSISGLTVFHYFATKCAGPYVVYQEEMEPSSVEGDNRKQIQTIQGTIDFFTRTEFDPLFDSIQDALNSAGISFRLNSFQREDETGLLHYEWVFEVS